MPDKMLALVKTQRGFGAELQETEIPKPQAGEVLLKVHRSSICGSDIPIYSWDSWAKHRIRPPLIFGHEICGQVAASGSSVKKVKVGDKVAVESHIFCDSCASCVAGDRHLCRRMALVGVDVSGGFAEYVALPERVLWKLQGKIPYDYASLMEPLGNAVYATTVEPVEGKTVVVMGCGPQGLYAVGVAKANGASLVVAVEKSPFRAQLAKKMGADRVFGTQGDGSQLREELLSLKETPDGFDVCLEMSGSTFLLDLAFKILRNGGRLSLFGLTAGKMGVDLGEDVIFKGLRIYGILGRRLFQTWQETERLVLSGQISLESVVSHKFPLQKAEEAFQIFISPQKNCGKIVFTN
ncbi:MAG: alcohol dehydrogenase catalytic domain-containing protein [Elusimicrobia bacterium]|nr:alcohol dehydrogenase catalytic domain-containing protein [Elusimicrobiota bacterium]